MDKVDKRVANITRVVVVDGQIKKVDLHSMVLADLFKKHFFRVFVGDVSDHQSGPSI